MPETPTTPTNETPRERYERETQNPAEMPKHYPTDEYVAWLEADARAAREELERVRATIRKLWDKRYPGYIPDEDVLADVRAALSSAEPAAAPLPTQADLPAFPDEPAATGGYKPR